MNGYDALLGAWQRYVLSQESAVEVEGRCVLLGDHTHVVKDGRRMPGVVSLRESSKTQRKPSYFRGQCWGAIALVVGTLLTNSIIVKIRRCFADADEEEYADGRWAA
jgi:hypothetical protein